MGPQELVNHQLNHDFVLFEGSCYDGTSTPTGGLLVRENPRVIAVDFDDTLVGQRPDGSP